MKEFASKLKGRKILWFTNTPSLYVFKSNKDTILGGWIPSLERIFRKNNIELAIACYFNTGKKHVVKDVYNKGVYYLMPQYQYNNKVVRWKRRLLKEIENESFILNNLKFVVDDFQPDLVQFWGSESPNGLIIPYLKVPHILHIQGNLTVYYKKYFSAFSKEQIINTAGVKNIIAQDNFFFEDEILSKKKNREERILGNCKNVFGRTDWDRRVSRILSPESNYYHCDEIIRNVFYDSTWRDPDNTGCFRLVSVFRESVYKGLETVYETAKLLKKQSFCFDWSIVGIENNSHLIHLINKVYKDRISDYNIEFLGSKNGNDIVTIFQQSNLLIHPSHIDNSPNSIAEAMLMGMPIIATNSGGVESLISNNESGILVQDGDPWVLAGAIIETYTNYNQLIKMGNKAQSQARKRHDPQNIFNTVVNTYTELIK